MARRRVYVQLSADSINNAINYLDNYRIDVENKKKEILKRLAELGATTARLTYASSRSITVSVVNISNGYRFSILAEGEPVCFLEFGAGVATDVGHPFASEVPFDVVPGSWSEEHSGQFSTYGWWIFGGRKYTQVRPRRGMLEADKMIKNRVVAIAREVFGYD